MVRVDFGEKPKPKTKPGPHLCEVRKSTEKRSKKGDAMFEVNWRGVNDPGLSTFDYIMMEGAGVGMGYKKLEALGWPPKFKGEIHDHELIGKRAWVFLELEEYKGELSLKADSGQGTHYGYQPESDTPEEANFDKPPREEVDPYEGLDEPLSADDTPF